MFYRFVCLVGSVSLAGGFHVHISTFPKLATLPMSTTADAPQDPQVSPASIPAEQDGRDLFDWNKQVSSESDPARTSSCGHGRLVRGEIFNPDAL